jgi:hypothetical protein
VLLPVTFQLNANRSNRAFCRFPTPRQNETDQVDQSNASIGLTVIELARVELNHSHKQFDNSYCNFFSDTVFPFTVTEYIITEIETAILATTTVTARISTVLNLDYDHNYHWS